MITHNILFHDETRKFPYIYVFSSYRKNLVGPLKPVRISHGKRDIDVRAIQVRLYEMAYLHQILHFNCLSHLAHSDFKHLLM